MKREFGDEQVARRIAAAMDRQVADQDASLQNRLAVIRREALAQRSDDSAIFRWGSFLRWSFGGAALAAATAVVLVLMVDVPPGESPTQIDDGLDLAMSVEDVELYADIDFYYWLNQQEESRDL